MVDTRRVTRFRVRLAVRNYLGTGFSTAALLALFWMGMVAPALDCAGLVSAQQPPPSPNPGDVPRFKFKIDPKTPLADLLPMPPQALPRPRVRLIDDPAQAPELAFQEPLQKGKALAATAHQIAKINHLNAKKTDAFMEALLGRRADLAALPFKMGDACRTKADRAREFAIAVDSVRDSWQSVAGNPGKGRRAGAGMRGAVTPAAPVDEKADRPASRPDERKEPEKDPGIEQPGLRDPNKLPLEAPPDVPLNTRQVADTFWEDFHAQCSEEDRTRVGASRADQEHVMLGRIGALMQILGPEPPAVRVGLAKYLGGIPHVEATRALAKLALFSAEEEVRQAAIDFLKVRREADYTDVLLAGFRYPLPAVGKRAADALIKLERKDLIPQLVDVLDEPDPRAPAVTDKHTVVRELVRVNHHRNCLLCHAPGNEGAVPPDTLTAQVPIPGEPLPMPSQGYQNSQPDILVRIDVTYLRQDFSMFLPVADASPWPEMQRFDFLIRNRVLTAGEAKSYGELFTKKEPGVLPPNHRAALAALRELTGRDTEPTAAAWRRLLGVKGRTGTGG
jgi:hypothetical protein